MQATFLRSLSFRQTRNTVLVALCLGFAISCAQVVWDIHGTRANVASTVRELMATVEDPAAEAAYELNARLAERILDGLFVYRALHKAYIVSDIGPVLASRERAQEGEWPEWLTNAILGPEISYSAELVIPGIDLFVGTLLIRVDSQYLTSAFMKRTAQRLLNLLIPVGLMAAVLLFMFTRSLTKPLEALSRHLSAIDTDAPAAKQIPMPKGHHRDELGLLVNTANALLTGFEESLKRRQSAEQRLILRESALTDAEEKYRTLFRTAVEGIFQSTPAGRVLNVNPSMARILGYASPLDIINSSSNISNTLYADSKDREKFLHLLRSQGVVSGYEVRMRRKDGGLVWCELHARPWYDEQGELTRIDGILLDITERKASEAELKQYQETLEELVAQRTKELSRRNELLHRTISDQKKAKNLLRSKNEQLQGILDHSPSLIHLKDARGRFVLVNKRFAQEFHNTPNAVVGLDNSQVLPQETARIFDRNEQCVRDTGKPLFEEQQYLINDSYRTYATTIFPLWDEIGDLQGLGGISSDITEARRLRSEAIRSAQLASLGELAAGVAHEINNPITGIINYAQLLSEDVEPDPADIANRIIKEGNRIASIVRSLLTFARKSDGVREPFSVAEVLAEALSLTSALLDKDGILLEQQLPEGLPDIHANLHEIQQVFINLLSNARHALNAKFPGRDPDKRLRIQAEVIKDQDRSFVRTVFWDQGVGMDETILKHIFEPFFTTKDRTEGTGLGLPISQTIVTNHGGRLGAESSPGEYTKISVVLPAHDPGNETD